MSEELREGLMKSLEALAKELTKEAVVGMKEEIAQEVIDMKNELEFLKGIIFGSDFGKEFLKVAILRQMKGSQHERDIIYYVKKSLGQADAWEFKSDKFGWGVSEALSELFHEDKVEEGHGWWRITEKGREDIEEMGAKRGLHLWPKP